jgi:hypothetical protein
MKARNLKLEGSKQRVVQNSKQARFGARVLNFRRLRILLEVRVCFGFRYSDFGFGASDLGFAQAHR